MVQTSVLASFTDSCFDLTEVAGRHGIEIADQAHFDTQIDHLQFSCRCSAMAIHFKPSNPSELSLHPRSRSAQISWRLYLSGMHWQHLQGRYFLLDTSKIPGSWTLAIASLAG